MNNTIHEIKRKQHKPQEITSEEDSPDEDMLEYDPDENNGDEYIKKKHNIFSKELISCDCDFKGSFRRKIISSNLFFATCYDNTKKQEDICLYLILLLDVEQQID
ncbi:hypothetical protein TNCV_2693721 [Trichonephila clavipes]|nr:hypothetical protein TNCV_2693721 [Trichonephila clavipes]